MRWSGGILAMVTVQAFAVAACSKTSDVGAPATDAGADAGEETLSPMDASPDGTHPDSSAAGSDAGEDGDGAFGVPGAVCVPSEQYADEEPCPSTEAGTPHTTFTCDILCYSFHSLLVGPATVGAVCAVGGMGEAGQGAVVPVTEAGTIVLCCPGVWDAAVPCEYFPAQ
jgi:hypothetical protein